jgi:hypothetical protein
MSSTPRTWTETLDRLAYVFGGRSDEYQATAQEWIAQAVDACWGARSVFDLSRTRRQIALQRSVGTTIFLEGLGELAFSLDVRDVTQRAFARYWKGAALEGPPWRLTPYEPLPLWADVADVEAALANAPPR